VREVARLMGVSHATVSQWETGKRVPDVESVGAYLSVIGADEPERNRILDIARGANDPSWLATGLPGASNGLAGILECERTTTDFVEWCPLLLPGLVQTHDYAQAILDNETSLSEKQVDGLVHARIDRRRVLTEDRDELGPAHYSAIINEHALRERIGGAGVLLAQLRELLAATELPTVTIRVLRAGGDWHPGLSGPFILYNFEGARSIVHIEHFRASAFLYDEQDIQDYKVAATVLRRRAMNPDDSAGFITEVIGDLERGG
jgi:transcriptional regulator with XRE-family HTH domain